MNAAVIIRIGVALAVVGAGALGYHQFYAQPKAAILAQIAASKAATRQYEKDLQGEFAAAAKIKAAGETTLGSKFDAVSARFRDGLARIAESQQLAAVTVDHGEPQPAQSPLLGVRNLQSSLKTGLRKPPDFGVLRGNLKGVGTLEQVLRTLDLAQAQPWLHRIEAFTIKPANKAQDRFELRLEVATLYAPEIAAGPAAEPSLAVVAPERGIWRDAIVAKHAFTKPGPPPPVVAPTVAVAAPSDPAVAPSVQRYAPYEDWRLAGVVRGGRGTEAFFVNVKTGERMTVQQGASLLDAVLVGGEGEQALIEIGGKRFEVTNGQTLAARKPVG